MMLLRTKARNGIDLPPNSRLTVDGVTVEVLGLAKTEEKGGFIMQWWIVSQVKSNREAPSLWAVLFRKE